MIVSASRRTDIPAYYTDWFFNRLKEGYVLVRNPMNFNQISRVFLDRKAVDCFVFWTKNPARMLDRLSELKEYNYYFQFTLTSYDREIEVNVPKTKLLISTFQELSERIGKERVIWRYDPIILTDRFTKDYHYKYFDYLCDKLHIYTEKCIISFMDFYSKTEKNMKKISFKSITPKDIGDIAFNFSSIAKRYSLELEACAEKIDLSRFGIKGSRCIDDRIISKISGFDLHIDKDPNQRGECGCVKSIDIGAYNTCNHGCLYCYANFNKILVKKNNLSHNPESPLLLGELQGTERIYDRNAVSCIGVQTSLFDRP